MKFCAYMTICLCLPFALMAEDDGTDAADTPPDADVPAAAVPVEQAVTDPGFERCKTILDRMPFGRPPPGFNPDEPSGPASGRRGSGEEADEAVEAEASEVEQQILSSVRVSMLNRTPEGKVFVGFTDSSVQPARNYLLELGEKREKCEWLVVAVDPDNRQVTLSKGGVEATLNVGGGGSPSGDKKAKEGEDGEKAAGRPGPVRGRPIPLPPGAKGDGKLSGLEIARARREARLAKQQAEEEQQRQAQEQLKKDREQAAEERKAQLDQLAQIQEELRRQREEKLAEQERRAAEEEASPQGTAQETVEE